MRTCFALALIIVWPARPALAETPGTADEPDSRTARETEVTSPLAADVRSDAPRPAESVVSTFSIVAFDPDRREWGIGVASKFLAVGSVVPWAQAETGAIATQSYANTSYGPGGLSLLDEGLPAAETLQKLTDADEKRNVRQVGIVDREGNAATYTGSECLPWAGGKTGRHFTCQGNILTGPEVVDEMASAYEASSGPLAWRILSALEAADRAGGDSRGKQSAAILIVREDSGYGGFNDRMIDFRVDDHQDPIPELARILALRIKRPQPETSQPTPPAKPEN